MTYADIFETESRGMFSPPNRAEPQIIPNYWRNASGEEVRTDLPELSDEELNDLGWKGPIQMPPLPGTTYFTHDYEWDTELREYVAIEINVFEKRSRVNYQKFWDDLIDSSAYSKIKESASQSLISNTLATELIALLTDAKNGHANVDKIQQQLLEILGNISFTSEELQEIETIFIESGMFAVYTLTPPTT